MRISTIAAVRIGFALACVVPAFIACGGSQPPAEVPPAPSASSSAPEVIPTASAAPSASAAPVASETASAVASTPPPPPQWKEMSKEQRKEFMKTVVMPKVKEDFAAFNAKKFANVTCATCHGEAAVKDDSYKMPNAKLVKLDPAGGFKKHMDKAHADATKFMMEKLTPDMAQLMNEPVFNPETKSGFGCAECHVMNVPAAKPPTPPASAKAATPPAPAASAKTATPPAPKPAGSAPAPAPKK